MSQPLYAKIHKISKETALLDSVQKLLDWDKETYMPSEAIGLRSEQLEMLSGLVHRSKTSRRFAKALSALIDLKTGIVTDDRLLPAQIAALREWKRDYELAIKIPNGFMKKFAKVTSTASHVWQSAKERNDFTLFAPHLEKVVALSRQQADILGFQEHPYDALLDLYEPGMKTSFLTPLFTKLKIPLKQLLKEIASQSSINDDFLYHHCPRYQQIDFAHKILQKLGLTRSFSRLDTSAHPFCTGMAPKDTRMTIRVHPENVFSGISALLHEGGHALYHANLPLEHYGSPLSEAVSLGIDESQSRWWETLIGQSEPFWRYFFPLLQKEFPEQFGSVRLEEFYRAINLVKPGPIRIEADEISYNLHIIVRFEIEKGLIEGSLKVKEIPEAWNEKMRENLGITPEFSGQGCLQDIHWSLGFIGYFPTYMLGNLYSVQFFSAFEKEHPHWKENVAQGSLTFIREWLKEKIHQHGRQYSSAELCQRITGSSLSEQPYLEYLNQKYRAIYQ